MSQFKAKLNAMFSDKNIQIAGSQPLTDEEHDLDERVFRPLVQKASIDTSKSFLNCKADYDNSELLRILQRMPKGGILHTHSIASCDFRGIVRKFRENPMCYVWKGEAREKLPVGTVKAFVPEVEREDDWVVASEVDEEELYNLWTMPSGLEDVKSCWKVFLDIWDRIVPMNVCVPIYFGRDGLLWDILQKLVEANVQYIEIKQELLCWTYREYDGTALSDEQVVGLFRDTVEEFKAEHPSFTGARIVLVSLKFFSLDSVEDHFVRAIALKKQFPDYIAGFDLAGPEDLAHPISFYAPMLEEHRTAAAADGVDIQLLIHAGESNLPGAPQILEAIAIDCKRIGHGFALSRYPSLIQEVKDKGISLECCPISNQVLGYTSDLATHPALGLLRAGVLMHISPDDPGPWCYYDVSYDFAAVAKAWDLGLVEIRALVRNSLTCSTLDAEDMEKALNDFDVRWDDWVKSELVKSA